MNIAGGTQDVTTYFVLRKAADGTALTGATITDIDLQYTRTGAAPVDKVDATALQATNSAHADNKAIQIDATSSPGLYRVDWPDDAFLAGVKQVILSVVYATAFTEHMAVDIDPPVGVAASVTGAVGSVTGAVGSVTGAVGSVTGAVGSVGAGGIAAASFAAGAITATVIADAAIDNATFAADVGSTAYATNIIALAADKAILNYDAPTNTEMVAAFTQIKGATWATTDTLEAIRDRGDAAWITAAGFATSNALTAHDGKLDTVDGIVDAILADTNELQTNQGNWLTATGFATPTHISALETHGDAEWATATGFSTHSAGDVWDVTLSEHLGAGSTGYALNGAGAAGDPWSTAIPGAYTEGTAGYILGNNIDGPISTRALEAGGKLADVLADTNELQTDWVNGGRLDLLLDATLADTGELQADWTNGGRLDLLLDAVLADTAELQTDDLPGLIGTPAGADIATDIASIQNDTTWLINVAEGDALIEGDDLYTFTVYTKDTATPLITKYLYQKDGTAVSRDTHVVGQQLESEL